MESAQKIFFTASSASWCNLVQVGASETEFNKEDTERTETHGEGHLGGLSRQPRQEAMLTRFFVRVRPGRGRQNPSAPGSGTR